MRARVPVKQVHIAADVEEQHLLCGSARDHPGPGSALLLGVGRVGGGGAGNRAGRGRRRRTRNAPPRRRDETGGDAAQDANDGEPPPPVARPTGEGMDHRCACCVYYVCIITVYNCIVGECANERD